VPSPHNSIWSSKLFDVGRELVPRIQVHGPARAMDAIDVRHGHILADFSETHMLVLDTLMRRYPPTYGFSYLSGYSEVKPFVRPSAGCPGRLTGGSHHA
jgi:hypothetical protein